MFYWNTLEQLFLFVEQLDQLKQCLVIGAILCFRNLYFYFQHGKSTSTASQLTSPASQKSKDLNKVLLLLQDLDTDRVAQFVQVLLTDRISSEVLLTD